MAFCRTFPLLDAMTDGGLFFRAVAELTGESPLLVQAGVLVLLLLLGVFGAGLDTGADLG